MTNSNSNAVKVQCLILEATSYITLNNSVAEQQNQPVDTNT